MKFYTHLMLTMAALFLIAACSSDSTTATIQPDTSTITPAGQDASGTWLAGCVDETTQSFNTTLSIASSVLTFTAPVYMGVGDCSGTADYTEIGTITLTFLDAVILATTEGVSRLTLTDTADSITPATAAGAAALNLSTSYGISNWTVGTAQSILGLADDGSPTSTMELEIMYINTAVTPNTLSFGNTEPGATTDSLGYPDTLSLGTPFTK